MATVLVNMQDHQLDSKTENQPSQHINVLEELLLALMGHSGDVFTDTSPTSKLKVAEPGRCTLITNEELSFIARPERNIMDLLLHLGFHYRELETYTRGEQFGASRRIKSQYRCAIANGIKELLAVYATAVLKLQRHIRESKISSLAFLNYHLAEFKVLLPCVHSIAYQVQRDSLSGSQILRLLHKEANCGISEVQACLERLIWHCHQVFYKQVRAWMVHGLLIDQCGEFLIQKVGYSEDAIPQANALRAEGNGIAQEWHQGFQVDAEALPPQINLETACDILFIGKAVRVLRPQQGSPLHDQLSVAATLEQLQAMRTMDASYLERSVKRIKEQAAERLWQLVKVEGELLLHLAALRDYFLMGRGDFWQNFLLESRNLMSLPVIQATAEANIAIPFHQSLGKSSAEGDPCFSNLAIRFPTDSPEAAAPSFSIGPPEPSARRQDVTSTERTDISASNKSATPAIDAGVRVPAGSAAWPMTTLKNTLDKNIPAVTPQTGESRAGGGRRGLKVPDYDPSWDPLALEYKVKWPLHLILTPQVMKRYGRLFQYLFRMKRMQLELDRAWDAMRIHKDQKHFPGPDSKSASSDTHLWWIRSHMAHFINNLQLYLQVDVIEVQFGQLLEKMQAAKDLRTAEEAHESFLAACIVQSCLDVPMFSTLLSKILLICKGFCASVMAEARDQSLGFQASSRLVDDFLRCSRLLYKLLSTPSMQSRARAPFLRQLLLRLNFNDFVQLDTDRHAAAQLPAKSVQL